MNESAFAKFLENSLCSIYLEKNNILKTHYYVIDVTDELASIETLQGNRNAYLHLSTKQHKLNEMNVNDTFGISSIFAHSILKHIKYHNPIHIEILITNRSTIDYIYTGKTVMDVINILIEKCKSEYYDKNSFSAIPKTAYSKIDDTIEYMQYVYINDRELKEWVGSAKIIDNGIHSPKKIVKAGHIIDKDGITHKLYMNDYVIKISENNTFIILSKEVFNMLFSDESTTTNTTTNNE